MGATLNEDWDMACGRFDAFWQREIIDRPCLSLTVRRRDVPPVNLPPVSPEQYWSDPETFCRHNLAKFSHTLYLGEADIIGLISPRHMQEVYLPTIVDLVRFGDWSIYRLDGPGAVRRVDTLLGIAELDGIQADRTSVGKAKVVTGMILDKRRLAAVYGPDAQWFLDNIPFFECPDKHIQEIYYFRWGVYRKHIRPTPVGYIISEFLPDVPWAGIHNSISCAAGHHFYEGRWLRDPQYLDGYARFWFTEGAEPRRYSFAVADAIHARFLATGDDALAIEFLPDLIRNYEAWEVERHDPSGLFWQIDDREGQEFSIGGSGCRPMFNSYMYGDALAIARIAERAGDVPTAETYRAKAARIKALVQDRLWDPEACFFKTLCNEEATRHHSAGAPVYSPGELVDVRELQGYVPWCFNLPEPGYEAAWQQLLEPEGFWGPYGPTTAERRHPYFMFDHPHECLWNGPSWPFATTQVLLALANLLNSYQQPYVGKADYLRLLQIYARSQYLTRPDGTAIPWIDENLHPDTGEWLARSILYRLDRPDKDRGCCYNHSGFCDLVITGLAGLRPRSEDLLEVNPLIPDGAWHCFCLEDVPYHGRMVTVLYDRSGERYGRGSGLRVLVDGQELAHSDLVRRLTVSI